MLKSVTYSSLQDRFLIGSISTSNSPSNEIRQIAEQSHNVCLISFEMANRISWRCRLTPVRHAMLPYPYSSQPLKKFPRPGPGGKNKSLAPGLHTFINSLG